jgi:SpoVK/Ycf46/Vps4 family AAA+-type ATPase
MLAGGNPTSMGRTLDVVDWAAVRPNYPPGVSEQLDKLMAFTPRRSGQIVLFYGEPGTGKTFAIRALAWEWRKWCSLHYIMDVPTFLSSTPEYMNTLLFSQDMPGKSQPLSVSPSDETVFFPDEDGELFTLPKSDAPPKSEQWRLIVLEDSGELLAENAREQTGAAMARLLNAADGLLGQGARVMFLITTNEPLDKLHPAVARPGRCVAHLNFAKFTREEAVAWLATQENAAEVVVPSGGATLAELYALIEARQQIVATERKRQPFGFKAA